MRRWFVALCCLFLLAGAKTAAQESADVALAAQSEAVHIDSRFLLTPPEACWSVAFNAPCRSVWEVVTIPICEGGVCMPTWKRLIQGRPLLLAVAAVTLLSVQAAMPADAQAPLKVLLIGDSTNDEYQADDGWAGYRDGCPASLPACHSDGWVEQIMESADRPNRRAYINFGQWTTWPDAMRRTGYEYNLSRSGATFAFAGSGLSLAQLNAYTQAASLLQANTFDVILISLGGNDFSFNNGGYAEVANGTVTPQNKAIAIGTAFNQLMTTIRQYSVAPVIVSYVQRNTIDQQAALLGYTSLQRSRAVQAMDLVNSYVDMANTYYPPAYPANSEALLAPPYINAPGGIWAWMGYNINLFNKCDDPRLCGLVGTVNPGLVHPGVPVSGYYANWNIDQINAALGVNIPHFTDTEIAQQAGILTSMPPSATPVPPTSTPVPPTSTAVPTVPTWTPTPAPTNTPIVPTATITNTPPPTLTMTHTPTVTPVPPTATPETRAIVVVKIDGVETMYFADVWTRAAGYCQSNGMPDYIGIYEPDGLGGYLPFSKKVCGDLSPGN